MATLTRNELAAAVAAIEWIAKRNDLATVLNRMPAMQAEKTLPTVTAKGLKKAINFLKQAADRAAQTARIAKGMKIKQWLKAGELDGTERDTKELLTTLGGMLDAASVDAIVGPNLFEGSDVTYYTVVVEASIEVAGDEFVNDVLQEVYEEGEDEEPPERNDGEPGPADVISVAVTAELPGKPLIDVLDTTAADALAVPTTPQAELGKATPAEDPDPRPGPRFGPPVPSPDLHGKTAIGELLDRVEAEAVAGADAETHARSDFILQTAAVAADRAVTAAEVKAAWDKFGTWDAAAALDHLRQLSRVLGATMGMGEHTSDELLQVGIVAALRANGVDSIAALDDAAELEERFTALAAAHEPAAGTDPETILKIAADARGFGVAEYRAELLEAIPHAWAEYGGWHLPTLKQEMAQRRENFEAAGGRGAFTAHRLDLMVMVVALREAGVESVDVLKTLKKNEDADAGTQLP